MKKAKMFHKKYYIYVIAIVLVFSMLGFFLHSTFSEDTSSTVWDGTIASSFASGTGTQSDPYIISNGSELAFMVSIVNDSALGPNYFNKYYELQNNIDLNNYNFSYLSIGQIFSGQIDGNGYTISNFTMNNSVCDATTCYQGLFYSLYDATIKNINFIDVVISDQNSNIDKSINFLSYESENSNIGNVSFSDIEFDYTTDVAFNSSSSLLFDIDNSGNTVNNLHISISSNVADTKMITSNYLNTQVNRIVYKNTTLSFADATITIPIKYSYTMHNNIITFDGGYSIKSILEVLNSSSSLEWAHANNTIRLRNNGISNETPEESQIVQNPSGISGSYVYVNDLVSDHNYYMGLNYTHSPSGSIPTTVNKNIYGSSNLVRTQFTYHGSDYNNMYTGYISDTERQNKLVYYKEYHVNNNGTPETYDDYILVDLIDNPFTDRPSSMAFNGWVSSDKNSFINLDYGLFKRTIKIPVSYENNQPKDIVMDLYASWVTAKSYNLTNGNDWSDAINSLNPAGFTPARGLVDVYYLLDYYTDGGSVRRWYTYPTGAYNARGTYVGGTYCRSSSCTYYLKVTSNVYDPSVTYYATNGSYMYQVNPTPTGTDYFNIINTGQSVAGFYREVLIPYGGSTGGYYNSSGIYISSGTCSNSSGCKLYEYIHLTDESGNPEIEVPDVDYYYFVTRDTNIIHLLGNVTTIWSSHSNPFTLTSLYNGTNYKNSYYWYVSNNLNIYTDTCIEQVRIRTNVSLTNSEFTPGSSGYNIYGNYKNLKIGRGITQYTSSYATFGSVIGGSTSGTGSSSNITKYNLIIESGYYNSLGAVTGSSSGTIYVNGTVTYGNDYDRVNNNNNLLEVRHSVAGTWSGYTYGENITTPYITHIVKSGQFGSNKYDYATGIYVGGRNSGTNYSPRKIIVEGGYIYNLIGGPVSSSSMVSYNDSLIYIKGGSIDIVIGGAGRSETNGNRIIQMTGGQVNYSVFGGSNGIQGSNSSNSQGTVNGDSYVYIGGTAVVGDESLIGGELEPNSQCEAGSVFGIGNGNANYDTIGTMNNSNVIIDSSGTVRNNVYGGGNYGALGLNSSYSSTSSSTIKMYGGTVKGSIYGGGNQNGSGSTSNAANIYIDMSGGTVEGSIYGGSRSSGIIYGNSNINIIGGSILNNVYGGGEGGYVSSSDPGTFVRQNVSITIGNESAGPVINGSVYGGSAYGTVNATTPTASVNSYTVDVVVNNGNIISSVFGGAKGSSSITPYVKGNINVEINGGTIGNVFGGFDVSGTPEGTSEVHLNGGVVGSTYGGGNNTSSSVTNVYLDGGTSTNVFGGSNQSGTVTTSNVYVNNGKFTNICGGNNQGGTTTTSYIVTTGGTSTNIFGGGNLAQGTTSNVTINGGTFDNVYGGGNQATVTTTNVDLEKGTVTNVYGGGNLAGATTTNINTITSESDLIVTSIYGGSNQSGNVSVTNINITDGTITNVYGGNNQGGVSSTTYVNINGATVTNVYGGGNLANVNNTNVVVNNGTVTNIFGGGNQASVLNDSSLKIFGGTVSTNVYGGGNFGEVLGDTHVILNNATILGSAYAGGNGETATVNGNTNITIGGSTVVGTATCTVLSSCSVFGGGNAAFTGTDAINDSLSNVNIAGATIYGNVYGGANTSKVFGGTVVNVGDMVTPTSEITKGNILIKGTIFGGGESNASGSEIYDYSFISVTKSINVNIDAANYTNFNIDGSIFGSGNASSTTGISEISIKNYGTYGYPKRNISIQRTNKLTVDNSSIVLEGATDRTNEYSNVLFTLSIIDELVLKNNSTLYLEENANLLKNFKSVDVNNNLATVTIDTDAGTVVKNVDNRLYMYEGQQLNIATNESVTSYGNVYGMTFFGMFKYDSSDNVYVGIYDKYDYDEQLNWGGVFDDGSYVLGAHKASHDITIDGFYTNYIDEDTSLNKMNYITPTPEDSPMYMWIIGELVIEYDVDLNASKYSTLGTYELPFNEFSDPNTSFVVLGVDYSLLDSQVTLVDKNTIPRYASTPNIADYQMGLSMEASNIGWLTTGSTTFYTSTPNIQGTTTYVGENSTNIPTMLFYLYHSKNIATTGDLGTVKIVIMAITKIDDLTNKTERLVVNVNISRTLYNTDDYEAALTSGRKYELFTSTLTNVTSKSTISAYYSLYAQKNLYDTGYHRTLVSNYVFPENTKITMIDLSLNTKKYYYHIINQTDVTNAENQLATIGEAQYDLSMFEVMGAFNSGDSYDDAQANIDYYHAADNYSSEEFIFIVDFSDTNITTTSLNNSLLLELQDDNDHTIINVLGIQHSVMRYNIYSDMDAVIEIDGTISSDRIYSGESVMMNLNTNYTQSSVNGNTVYDTRYFNSKLGIEISLFNSEGELVSGTSLLGLYYEIDGQRYYPNIDGTTRIKLADKVGNLETWVKVVTGTSQIATGNYTLRVASFGSPDGIYYGLNTYSHKDFNIYIVNEIYGLNIHEEDKEMIVDQATGLTLNGTNTVTYEIDYNSGLENPKIHVKMSRRKYDTVYSSDYLSVDLANYVSNVLISTSIPNEYLLVDNPNEVTTITLYFKPNIQNGTYKLEFILYDGTSAIGTVEKYIIIK